jgi:hypothetical protein
LTTDAFLTGNQAGHSVAYGHGFQRTLLDTRTIERALNRLAREVFHAAIHMFSEAGHARANNGNLSHW